MSYFRKTSPHLSFPHGQSVLGPGRVMWNNCTHQSGSFPAVFSLDIICRGCLVKPRYTWEAKVVLTAIWLKAKAAQESPLLCNQPQLQNSVFYPLLKSAPTHLNKVCLNCLMQICLNCLCPIFLCSFSYVNSLLSNKE